MAHLFLSGDDEELLIGNFIGDSVKGNDAKNFPEEVQRGILLHRSIDSYTDLHPVVRASVDRLQPTYHKYSAVIMDIFYDHFLAVNWNEYHPSPLQEYADRVYDLLLSTDITLPERAEGFMHYMIYKNILVDYARVEGIGRVLDGMARRAQFESGMEHAVGELEKDYALYENEFRDFFPELVLHVSRYLEDRFV